YIPVPGRPGLGTLQKLPGQRPVFAALPLEPVHVDHIECFLWPDTMPDGIAGIAQLQEDIEIPFARILQTVQVIDELPCSTDLCLPIRTMDNVDAPPFSLPVRMIT